jgi:GTP-binding protein
MPHLPRARFAITVNHLADLPTDPIPEVAFAGRSNAGKSTAINILCNQKRLAFASKTPGRTQHINFFAIPSKDKASVLGNLIDLPGYGYAAVSGNAKAHWEKLLGDYIQTRHQLAGLVIMMDARRPFTDLDCAMIEWFLPTQKPLHILLTKADKLNRNESAQALHISRKCLSDYAAQQSNPSTMTVQLFSSLKRQGLEEATQCVETWLGIEKVSSK